MTSTDNDETRSTVDTDSGTGWPADSDKQSTDPWSKPGPHVTAELPAAASKSAVPADDDDKPAKAKRGGPRWWHFWRWGALSTKAFMLAMVAGIVVILVLVLGFVVALPHLGNPFKSKTTDRSQPVLLLSIQDLARFEAASGNFQVIIDVQQDRSFIPDILFSERSLFVAAGSVDAYVDFSNLGPNAVVASADRKTVTITLPTPALESPNLDLSRSYVYAEQQGLVNKLQGLFGGDPNKESELYQLGQQKIAAAAVDSGLQQRAEQNTKLMLDELLKSLGFTTVTINFPNP